MSGVEVATKISELVATNPPGSDPKSEGDNHLRLIKGVLQDVFDDSGTTLKTTLPIESPDGAKFGASAISGLLSFLGTQAAGQPAIGQKYAQADLFFGVRPAAFPLAGDKARFVFNTAPDGSGTDILILDDTGKLIPAAAPDLKTGFLDGKGDTIKFDSAVAGAMPLTVQMNALAAQTLWSGQATTQSFAGNGYQKLPSGLILQWMTVVNGSTSDWNQALPTAYPNGHLCLMLCADNAPPATQFYGALTSNLSKAAFDIRARGMASGGVVSGPVNLTIHVFSIGW